MKRTSIHVLQLLLLVQAAILLTARPVSAQVTAFGYQGRLNTNGLAASGYYDFSFSLYDAAANGNLLGASQNLNAVGVTNGLFSVTLDFGSGVFTGPPRYLQLQVRTNGNGAFSLLNPRQPMLPTPYSMYSALAGTIASGAAVKSLNGLQDQVNLAAGQNVTITPNGNTLTISSAGAGGAGIWSVNANNAYYTAGNVGIGTSTPVTRLAVSGGPLWTAAGWLGTLELDDISAIAWHANNGGNRFGIGHTSGGLFFFRTASDPGNTANPAVYDLMIDDSGNVGLGTVAPKSQFHVSGYQPVITLEDTSASNERAAIQGVNGAINLFSGDYLLGPTFGNPYGYLSVSKSGNVGIGTATPAGRLDVRGSGITEATVWSVDERAILSLHSTAQNMDRTWTLESGLFGTGGLFGIYDRTAGRARLTIDTTGLVAVDVLQIRGGADLSEHFDVAVADSRAEDKVTPGMVVCIDPDRPGKLKVSSEPYDQKVAGIVSGAGGIKPGMMMSQSGSVADGESPVALTGRVYCLADATFGAIRPGDLLTSSGTPGHAMRASQPAKAYGAILGKAMTGLQNGRGMILVLVGLQ